MKYIIALVFILTINTFGLSQKIKVTVGPVLTPKEIKQLTDAPKFKIIWRSTSIFEGLFFDSLSNKTFTYFGFSGDKLRFIVSDDYIKPGYIKALLAEMIKEGDKESIQLLSFIYLNKRLFIFYAIDFPKTDQFSVYVNEVSKDFVVMGSPILVHSYGDLKKYGHSVSLQSSRNNQYFLIYRDIETKQREQQKFECTVIDASFAEAWSKVFEIENKDKEINTRTVDIDNNGNVFVLAQKEAKLESGPVLYFYGWKDKIFKTVSLGLNEGNNFGVNLEIVDGIKPYLVGLNQQKKNVSCFIGFAC